jgi:phosphatidylglycerol:prolipoprotein diacylglycerol transferase
MYPFIHLGPHITIGTFGLLLWLAAVCACWVLHRNFLRAGVDADAIGVVAIVTVLGIVGAKLWHVADTPGEHIFEREGFAWFGGLVFGILALLWQGRALKIGAIRMLDLAAPAAAVGYGMGRLGCLISGDGDYGIPTKLPWGMSFPNGLVPTTQRVHPTPIYELIAGLLIGYYLWRRGAKARPLGQINGEYLILSGVARFLVEFIRINPKIYWGLSNAQLASLGSVAAGVVFVVAARWYAAKSPVADAEPAVEAKA